MLCERCGLKKAEIHLMRVANGKRVVSRLCRECAQEVVPFDEAAKMMKMTFSLEGIMDLQEALRDLILPVVSGIDSQEESDLKCPHCGGPISFSMYDPFEDKCAEKVPCAESMPAKSAPKDELTLLKERMSDAVCTENYELAAEIRDQIKDLEEGGEKKEEE